MGKENYHELRAEQLGLAAGTGKRYSREDLDSFINASLEREGKKNLDRFTRNLVVAFAIPPTLALVLTSLPRTEVPIIEAAKGVSLMITAAETGWVGGGVLIEGAKLLGKVKSLIPARR